MFLDDLVLSLQQRIDRAIRRLRRGAQPQVAGPRLLIIQIDGLSGSVLRHALDAGHMRFVRGLLGRGGYRLQPMSVGLPTSTPAFQMAAMYGVRPDIPGFHYYSRERKADIHFPRAGHAAWVEERLAKGRRGILEGGSAYGCCFTGGADNNFFSFASLTRPSGRGLACALSPFVVLAWVAAKNFALTLYELGRALPRWARNPRRARQGWRWIWMRIGMSIWVRNFFTMAVSRDLYAGVPAVYVNYLDYDVAAHEYGPRSRRALAALRGVDRGLSHLWKVMRRVPEHRYEAYILADHGQTPCTPYQQVAHGRRLERWMFDAFLHPGGTDVPEAPRAGLRAGLRDRRSGTAGMFQRFMNYLDEDYFRRPDPEAHQERGLRAIAAGPNAFLYVLDAAAPLDAAALERRFPRLAEKLSLSAGIGFVLARSGNGGGPLCCWQGRRCELSDAEPGPFAGRADAPLVVAGIRGLMSMPSAGDLVIYGTGAAGGAVSFIAEHGAHAGPSADEMQTFILRPAHVALPAEITHPAQLYEHFIRCREEREPGPAAGAIRP